MITKGFRDQLKDCKENESCVDEKCVACGHELLTCRIYGGLCMSGKCREARLNNNKGKHFFRVTRTWYVRADKAIDAADMAKNWDHDELMVQKLENVIPLGVD